MNVATVNSRLCYQTLKAVLWRAFSQNKTPCKKMDTPRVLSIQSHVVRGYVGNKSATFPLQVLGFEVDGINSVHLSNHTGYKVTKGQILKEQDLRDVVDGLVANDLHSYSHLLTGYVGSPSFLQEIANVVCNLRKKNPNLIYVCDPVMGDNGKLYVPESLLPIYKDVILPLADILTPNQFEAELLSGKKIKSIDDAWTVIDEFHAKGCKTVLISSSDLGGTDELLTFASSKSNGGMRVILKIPRVSAIFTGTGDLFAALILAWTHKTGGDLKVTIENTIATLQAVIKRTLNSALEASHGEQPGVEHLELKLIQSKGDIEKPSPILKAEVLA